MEKVGLTQSKMKVVITGSIASGKSTVSNFIREKGFKVIDSDSFAKEILRSDFIDDKVRSEFGFSSTSEDFKREIFKNGRLRDFVDKNVYTILYDSYRKMNEEIVFYEIPLYFESVEIANKMGFIPDLVLYVYADKDVRHFRMKKYRDMSEADIISREKCFLEDDLKISKSDFVILNNGDTKNLFMETERFLDEKIKKID